MKMWRKEVTSGLCFNSLPRPFLDHLVGLQSIHPVIIMAIKRPANLVCDDLKFCGAHLSLWNVLWSAYCLLLIASHYWPMAANEHSCLAQLQQHQHGTTNDNNNNQLIAHHDQLSSFHDDSNHRLADHPNLTLSIDYHKLPNQTGSWRKSLLQFSLANKWFMPHINLIVDGIRRRWTTKDSYAETWGPELELWNIDPSLEHSNRSHYQHIRLRASLHSVWQALRPGGSSPSRSLSLLVLSLHDHQSAGHLSSHPQNLPWFKWVRIIMMVETNSIAHLIEFNCNWW